MTFAPHRSSTHDSAPRSVASSSQAPVSETELRQAQTWQALQRHTMRPVAAQRQAAQPTLRAASLAQQETERLQHQRHTVQAQLDTLSPDAAGQATFQWQPAVPAPKAPQTPSDWVTVMRARAAEVEGQRLNPRQYAQFTALQRQVAQTLAQGFRTDQGAPAQRYQLYGEHLAALQRHPVSAPVSRVVLGLVPPSERAALQRAVDSAVQRSAAQARQDDQAAQRFALQRQLAELDAEDTQPVFQRIHARRGAGNPLPEAVQRQLEQGLNHNLDAVRIHDDAEADRLAKSLNALAFTTGTDIYFQSGKYAPNTQSGLELLAHEATHAVQQSKGQVGKGIDPDPSLEAEAKRAESKFKLLSPAVKQAPQHRLLNPALQTTRTTGTLQRTADTTAINKAITLPTGQQPQQGWLQKIGQAAWKAAYEQPIYQAGVLAGVVEGFFTGIWDNIKALGAVASQAYRLIQDIFTGQITSRIDAITQWVKNLSWNGIKQIGSELGGQLKAQILSQVQAWIQPNPFQRGRAQGKIVGLILAEVGIAYLTAGTVTVVKNSLVASGKVAQVVSRIPGAVKLIEGAQKKRAAFKTLTATAKTAATQAVKKLIPEAWLKRLGLQGTAQAEKALQSADAQSAIKQGGLKAKELPVAVAMAVSISLANDLAGTPVAATIKQLNLLKKKFSWIKTFAHKPQAKGVFKITMIASEIPIYSSYKDLDLSKFKNIDSHTIQHIFEGEVEFDPVTGKRQAGGWHFEATGNPEAARVVKVRDKPEKDAFGVYTAKVEMKDVKTGEWLEKSSTTFFPKGWTPQMVLEQVDSAFKNITKKTDPAPHLLPDGTKIMSYVWEGVSESGVPIKGFFDLTNQRIISAFPLRTKK